MVKLLDLEGRVLLEFETNSMVENFNVSNLSSGIYLVEVTQGNSRTVIRLAID